jgi:O-antigen/teichoic acid export membrane protein
MGRDGWYNNFMAEEVTLGDVDLTTVKARTLSGIVTLISRSFILQIVASGGFLLLSIFLGIPEIGLFIAVNDLVSILGYFSDIGLAASLVQKKEKVTISDLRTTFTIQQTIVIVLIAIMLLLSPVLMNYYNIADNGRWLLYSLLAAFFLASLKTIPSVVLERQVRFEVLAAVEVVETIVFYLVAVTLAWRGAGVMSYAWAVILRGVVGTGLIYYLAPWPVGIGWSKASLKTLLSFGIPYQLNTLMAVVKDRFVNIALWKIIGQEGVGIIGWAQTWSQKPLRFIMDNVTRVTFPSYARLQEHPEELKRAIEKTLFFITAATFPILAGIAILAFKIVNIIPKYNKWEIALLPLSLYCINSALASISTPLTNTLNAIGKVKVNTFLMIMWTVLTWILTPWMAIEYGFIGVAYASAIISFTSFIPVIIVRRLTNFSLVISVGPPALATLVMATFTLIWSNVTPIAIWAVVSNIGLSAIIFSLCLYLISPKTLITDSKKIFYAFRKK